MVNSRKIEDLNKVLQRAVEEFLKRCEEKGLKVCITQTLRDTEYQNWLYSQGRTREGSIVTNAKGGYSNHNFGIAFDICKNVRGEEYSDVSFFEQCGAIWEDMGGTWGGNFKSFVDRPHFEFTNGLSTSEFRSGKVLSEDVRMEWEKMSVIKTNMLFDGVETEVNVIQYESKNYVELRELKKLGLDIDYDAIKKLPIVNSK